MPIIFDEVTAEVTPPAPTPNTSDERSDAAPAAKVDPASLARELQRLAERAERLNAD